MRIPLLLFGLALGVGLLLLHVVFGVPEVPQLRPHPAHPSLLQGADGADRVAPVWWIGAVFGALQIAFFAACFALGTKRGAGWPALRREIALGTALYAGAFALLLWSHRAFLDDPGAHIVLGFPLPTAVMLYLLWPAPLFFVWIYLRHFDEQMPDAAELERIRRIGREVAEEEARR